jgi:hypothetical protein
MLLRLPDPKCTRIYIRTALDLDRAFAALEAESFQQWRDFVCVIPDPKLRPISRYHSDRERSCWKEVVVDGTHRKDVWGAFSLSKVHDADYFTAATWDYSLIVVLTKTHTARDAPTFTELSRAVRSTSYP